MAVAHFAERYSLFVIICLGESIVAIGAQASSELTAHVLVIFSLCMLATVGLWWTYFDEVARAAEERLRVHGDPVLAAADAYSYIHLVIVAGIIVFAVGAKLVIEGSGPGGLALCGGAGIYLIGHAGFAWRMLETVERSLLVVAVVLFALCPVADQLPGWAAAAVVAALLGGLCAKRPAVRR